MEHVLTMANLKLKPSLFMPLISISLERLNTLKCQSYFSLPFVHKGVHLDPFIFRYFPVGILVRNLHHICIHLKQP